MKKKMVSAREATSAMGNAHQTNSNLPVRDKRYATGTSTINWRAIETSMDINPCPRD